jgi:hypothetical protein
MKYRTLFNMVIFLACTLATYGQSGSLSGTLKDRAGAPVPNVVLVVTNVSTGTSQRVATGADGSFTISLTPGTYRVEAESTGFKRLSVQDVEVAVGKTAQLTLTLEPGPATETVQLTADAVATQSDPPEIARAYPTHTIYSLPVFDRSYQQLSSLMPGVTPPESAFDLAMDPQRSRQFHTNGLPAFANDNTYAGNTIREPYTGTLSIRVLPDEDIEQLNVRTSNYKVDSGFAAGSISNVVSRPATNDFHGSLFGFFSNDFLQARNPLNSGDVPTRLHYWQAGATAGGAIVPEKTFIFGSYEATLDNGRALQLASVPTADLRTGNFSGLGSPIFDPFSGGATGAGRSPFSGATIRPAQMNAASVAILNALPAPNLPGLTNNLVAAVPYDHDSHVADLRLDQRFSDALTANLIYGFTRYRTDQGSIFGPVVGNPMDSGLQNHHAAASVVGNYHGVIGEFRFAYNRYRNQLTPTADTAALNQELGNISTFTVLPTINIAGWGMLGEPANIPAKMIDDTYEGQANFHIYQGRHSIGFGLDIRRLESNGFTNYPFGPNGTFFFGPGATALPGVANASLTNTFANSFAAFLAGAPVAGGTFTFTDIPSYRQTLYAGYLSDMIRLAPRFAIDLGVRYDVFSPVEPRHSNGALIFDPVTNTVNLTGTSGFDSRGNVDYDLNNISPRVGFAFNPMKRTVIRASYAIQYFPVPFNLTALNPAGVGTQRGITSGGFGITPFSFPVATVLSGTAPNIPLSVIGGTETPYTQNYYFMIQQDMGSGLLFDVAYVGNVGRQLPFVRQLNVALPGTGLTGLPFDPARTAAVSEVGTGLTSNYNALQVNLTKRLSRGVGLAAAYTWSKALDHGTALIDPFRRSLNYGPADWDRTHMLTISHIFEIPIGTGINHFNTGLVGNILAGWQVNGIFQWATGTPYSVLADPLVCNCPGVGAVFANIDPAARIDGQASFNPALFSPPVFGTTGTLGRNALRGPDMTTYNLSLFKSFASRERFRWEFRAEAYNLLNTTAFGNPVANLASPNLGAVTMPLNGVGGRQFLLGTRILF